MRVAAVDLGTNSARLLIADGVDGVAGRGLGGVDEAAGTVGGATHLVVLQRDLRLVRLGQGVDATGLLAPEAIERTVVALTGFAERWRAAGAQAVRITTTSAARDATNRDDLLDAVATATGVRPEVISGDEEAAHAFVGAAIDQRDGAPLAVLDIGGGSTELVAGTDRSVRSRSVQMGSVRLTELHLTDDPPTAAQVEAARTVVAERLRPLLDVLGALTTADPRIAVEVGGPRLLAVAGTATTVAAIHLGLTEYAHGEVHGTVLTRADLVAVEQRLLGMTAAEIAEMGAVQPGREDVIAAGAVILRTAVELLGFGSVTVAETDGLDGVALSLLAGEHPGAELVDLVDAEGTVTEVASRTEMRRRSARHRCTYIVVMRSTGHVVVHRRAEWKDVSPNAWDLAFGGVCAAGEGWEASARRELAEEAGLVDVELRDLGQVTWEEAGGAGSSLVGRVYLAVHDGPLSPSDGEVVALDEVPLDALEGWMAERLMVDDSPEVVVPLLLASR